MNLRRLITQYVQFRQSLGERFHSNRDMLRAFGRAIGKGVNVADVTPQQVRSFLDGNGPVTSGWFKRHDALLGFYRYAISRGYVRSNPLPTVLPKPPPCFVPYIYTRGEVRRLLQATDSYQRPSKTLDPATMRTFVLLLYGTGLRVHEAISLNRADVDLLGSVITVRESKFFKTRLVPYGQQLGQVLASYVARPCSSDQGRSGEAAFFKTPSRPRISQSTFNHSFRNLCEHAGIRRQDQARYQPRPHDLRHTFAVHRLTTWYRQGADVQRLLPHLSTYLGHVSITATQVYLNMTPELLQEASLRFESYVGKEGNHG